MLVLWDYDAGCSVTRYGGPLPLGVVGDTVFVRARLRDESEWVDGLPTYDSFWAGAHVYETASLTAWRDWILEIQREFSAPPWEREVRMSPREVFALVASLPQPCDYVWNRSAAATQLELAQIAHLGDRRFPVQELLESHEGALRPSSRDAANCYDDPRRHWWDAPW